MQPLSVYTVYVTLPPAPLVAPLKVALSFTPLPAVMLEAESVVPIVGLALPTVNGSLVQTLVADALFASPL